MASQLQLRGGTTAEHGSFTGAIRELTVDTTLKALRLHDGVTPGGTVIASLSDIQALITALSNSTTASLTTEANDRAAAVASLTALISSSDATLLTTAQSYTDTKVTDLLGGAPALLDTLNELAAAINDDENFATTLTTTISNETTARGVADAALQAAVDLRATIDDPTFTTKISSPEFHSVGGHLKFKASTNDIMFYPNNIETLQITRDSSTGYPKFTANGGSGEFKFNQIADFADGFKVGNNGALFFKESTGRLGLGETNPGNTLHVKGGAIFQRSNGSSKLVITQNTTDDGMTIQGQSNSGNSLILDTVGGSAAVKFTNNDHGTLASLVVQSRCLRTSHLVVA